MQPPVRCLARTPPVMPCPARAWERPAGDGHGAAIARLVAGSDQPRVRRARSRGDRGGAAGGRHRAARAASAGGRRHLHRRRHRARGLELLPAGAPVLVLPTTAVGKSNEHIDFPGTLTLSAETLSRVWYEIGASVRRAGVRKLLLFNSHGGQPQVMQIVARELRIDHQMLVVAANWFSWGMPEGLFDPAELRHGIHGGTVETAMMLALRPDLVDSDRRGRLRPGHRRRRSRLPAPARAGRRGAGLAGPGPAPRRRLRRRHPRHRRGRAGGDRPCGPVPGRAAAGAGPLPAASSARWTA